MNAGDFSRVGLLREGLAKERQGSSGFALKLETVS